MIVRSTVCTERCRPLFVPSAPERPGFTRDTSTHGGGRRSDAGDSRKKKLPQRFFADILDVAQVLVLRPVNGIDVLADRIHLDIAGLDELNSQLCERDTAAEDAS